MTARLKVEMTGDSGAVRRVVVTGRVAQMLQALVSAGASGVTAQEISSWAVRSSHYIFVLRHEIGLRIDTRMEAHNGPFPGRHGRYVLRDPVRVIRHPDDAQAAA